MTGAAGFIGSHLAQAALDAGHDVLGVDCLTDYYDPRIKRANLARLAAHDRFEHAAADLGSADLEPLIDGADVVHHLAGQPGVRLSWSTGFDTYVARNVTATQRLLEAARETRVGRLVYASSSSVYGNAPRYPTRETDLPAPYSPYGVTKLAGEHLCALYSGNWGVPAVVLRYFTVYGPRQRPDMGLHRFIAAAMSEQPIPVYGDGEQVRDFTFVEDVVHANLAAADADLPPGTIMNVAGGGSITVNELLALLGEVAGRELEVSRGPDQAGDVRQTGGSTDRAHELLGWEPKVTVAQGLRAQYAWQAGSA
ncbi:MAG: NAD-dependent epimerase/dehydratase family protein [Actinomycetales bacterium]